MSKETFKELLGDENYTDFQILVEKLVEYNESSGEFEYYEVNEDTNVRTLLISRSSEWITRKLEKDWLISSDVNIREYFVWRIVWDSYIS